MDSDWEDRIGDEPIVREHTEPDTKWYWPDLFWWLR